jgi:hypothetical protein
MIVVAVLMLAAIELSTARHLPWLDPRPLLFKLWKLVVQKIPLGKPAQVAKVLDSRRYRQALRLTGPHVWIIWDPHACAMQGGAPAEMQSACVPHPIQLNPRSAHWLGCTQLLARMAGGEATTEKQQISVPTQSAVSSHSRRNGQNAVVQVSKPPPPPEPPMPEQQSSFSALHNPLAQRILFGVEGIGGGPTSTKASTIGFGPAPSSGGETKASAASWALKQTVPVRRQASIGAQ